MKKLLLIILLFCIKQVNSQTTVPGGYVYGTWTLAGSPYLIQGSLEVPNDSTLTIQPGVKIDFQGHYKLIVLGRLLAIGTQTDSVFFTASNTSAGWYGIRFDNTTANNDTSKISYCNLQWGIANGSGVDQYGGAFMFNGFSKVIVSNCLIKNNFNYAIYCTNSNPIISSNNISYCTVGGFYLQNSNPNISNNVISHNNGDGIFGGTNITIYNNNISYNSGVGIYVSGGTISYNTISYNNSAYWAGGIYTASSNPTLISHNIISYNTSTGTGYGGGIMCYICDAIISDNIISNNSAPYGGGILTGGSTSPTIINNLIANNTATSASGNGGGVSFNNSNSSIFMNNTIVNNSAINGGGVYIGSSPSIYNCIIYGNIATSNGNQVDLPNQTGQPNFYNCDIQGGSAVFGLNGNFYSGTYSNNINADPLFVSPSSGSGTSFNGVSANWSLQSNSPCINTGSPSGTYPTTDIAGNPRVYGSIIDIGAYEYQGLVGIKQLSIENNQINIYPNPTNSSFTIETINTEKQAVQVFDINGKTVLTQTISGKTNIDATNLSEGVYNVSVINSSGVLNKRLVIVR